jgi:hypothetical protein
MPIQKCVMQNVTREDLDRILHGPEKKKKDSERGSDVISGVDQSLFSHHLYSQAENSRS